MSSADELVRVERAHDGFGLGDLARTPFPPSATLSSHPSTSSLSCGHVGREMAAMAEDMVEEAYKKTRARRLPSPFTSGARPVTYIGNAGDKLCLLPVTDIMQRNLWSLKGEGRHFGGSPMGDKGDSASSVCITLVIWVTCNNSVSLYARHYRPILT